MAKKKPTPEVVEETTTVETTTEEVTPEVVEEPEINTIKNTLICTKTPKLTYEEKIYLGSVGVPVSKLADYKGEDKGILNIKKKYGI
jgi:hypothetical protein